MPQETWEHGYGSHRRETFERYYHRNMVSEGCGCGERVLDPTNRPSDPFGLVRVLAWLAGSLMRRGGRTVAAGRKSA